MIRFLTFIAKYLPSYASSTLLEIVEFLRIYVDKNHFLWTSGYVYSKTSNKPIDYLKNPIPWFNYATIDFINDRINETLDVFEFGSGYSTLYFAKKVNSITSVEYDLGWFSNITNQTKKLNNVNIIYNKLDDSYPQSIEKLQKKYDLIIVDGRMRVESFKISINCLKVGGILILDDSSRSKYIEAFNVAKKSGYKHISFNGLKPAGYISDQTTIFYKENNCFDL